MKPTRKRANIASASNEAIEQQDDSIQTENQSRKKRKIENAKARKPSVEESSSQVTTSQCSSTKPENEKKKVGRPRKLRLDVSETVQETVPETANEPVPKTVKETTSEKAKGKVPAKVKEIVAEKAPKKVPKKIKKKVPKKIKVKLSKQVKEKTTEKVVAKIVKKKVPKEVKKKVPKEGIKKEKICEICGKVFTNLNRHRRIMHPKFAVRPLYECNACGGQYNRKDNLVRHFERLHMKEEKAYPCEICGKKFRMDHSLTKHMSTAHINPEPVDERRKNIPCALCSEKYHSKSSMLWHLQKAHNIQVEREELQFATEEEFYKWQTEIEKDTICRFIRVNLHRRKDSDCISYKCHRSGMFKSKSSNKRRMKLQGTKKINAYCPAEMIFRKKHSGGCEVSYTKTHLGHGVSSESELKHIFLRKEVRKSIAEKLAAGVPKKSILAEIGNSTGMDIPERLSLLRRQDLKNVARSYNLSNPGQVREKSSSVEALLRGKSKNVLFRKKANQECEKFPYLNDEDEVLVVMTPEQERIFKESSGVVCIHNAHGFATGDFSLYTLLVIDQWKEGYATAFAVCSRSDESMVDVLLTCVAEKIGVFEASVLITDLADNYYNSWVQIMGEPAKTLLSIWHVHDAWRKNFKRIRNEEKRNWVRQTLYELSVERYENEFLSKFSAFLNCGDEEIGDFLNYFQENFGGNAECWAYCFRVYAGINTNIDLEAFHSDLRGDRSKAQEVKSFADGVKAVFDYIKKKESSVKGQMMKKLAAIRMAHDSVERMETVGDEKDNFSVTIENHDPNTWLVFCFDRMENDTSVQMYTVEKVAERCADCKLVCEQCNMCMHEYTCTCDDWMTRKSMCKHVHSLGIQLAEATPSMTVNSAIETEIDVNTDMEYYSTTYWETIEEAGEEESGVKEIKLKEEAKLYTDLELEKQKLAEYINEIITNAKSCAELREVEKHVDICKNRIISLRGALS